MIPSSVHTNAVGAQSTPCVPPTPPIPSPSPAIPDALWSIKQLEEFTHVNERTLRRQIDAGKFPAGIKIGACRRWNPTVVRAHVQSLSEGGI